MGLLSNLLLFPITPLKGVTWIAEQIAAEADRQWSDPATVEAGLRDVQARLESGEIDQDEAARLEEELVERLLR